MTREMIIRDSFCFSPDACISHSGCQNQSFSSPEDFFFKRSDISDHTFYESLVRDARII